MLESTAPGWTELVNKMQAAHATALAEARAEGRRQGLEEAAKIADQQQALAIKLRDALLENEIGHGRWDLASVVLRDVAAAIRSLATTTAKTQKPETGESNVSGNTCG